MLSNNILVVVSTEDLLYESNWHWFLTSWVETIVVTAALWIIISLRMDSVQSSGENRMLKILIKILCL